MKLATQIEKMKLSLLREGFSLVLFAVLFLFSCNLQDPAWRNNLDGPVKGLKPVYLSKEEAQKIEILAPRAMVSPGKIYVYGSFLFVNELFSGVHIINNADPANPVPLSFIKIHGNVDIAVKGNALYADNAGDLVALDISNLNQVKLSKRIENVFPSNNFPSQTGVYFECVDPAKGYVTGWEETTLEKITCSR